MLLMNIRANNPTHLTHGKAYFASMDRNGDLRVKDDSGKMNKYGLADWLMEIETKDTDMPREVASFMNHKDTQVMLTTLKAFILNGETLTEDIMTVLRKTLSAETGGWVVCHASGVVSKGVIRKQGVGAGSASDPPTIKEATAVGLVRQAVTIATITPTAPHNKTTEVTPMNTPTEQAVAPQPKKMTIKSFLQEQGVPLPLIVKLMEWRKEHLVDECVKDRIEVPHTLYQGGEIWTAVITAVLNGNNILLQGAKATGKNVLASGLAFLFGRPLWDISFHTNIDAGSLIGAETFKNGQVEFRPGAVFNCSLYGGFGVLDEINMAKNEAIAVLHSVTDDRRVIDVPGYERLKLHEATRFIATMNYGYAGTREINEALASRFVIIHMPQMKQEELVNLFKMKYPNVIEKSLTHLAKSFLDLERKAESAEISTKAVDLRGYIDALGMMELGQSPFKALNMCVINKAFDSFERTIIADTIKTLIPHEWTSNEFFAKSCIDTGISVDFGKTK